jgi:hypothetical protein
MASTPSFVSTPRIGSAQISTANTNRDGTGTIGTVIAGVAAGTRVMEVVVTATGTTTAGMVRLYLYDGSNTRLFSEVQVTAITVGASTKAFTATVTFDNLILPSTSWELRASTHNAETFNVVALAGDLT